MRLKFLTITILCLLIMLFTGNALADKTIVMTFLGDCTLGGEDRLLHKPYAFAAAMDGEGYGYYFKNVKDLLAQDDLTVANLECVLRTDTRGGSKDKTYVFRGEPEYTQVLTLGSVEAVGLENNHTLDFGDKGLADTKQALDAAGISYFDMSDTLFYEKDGIRVAFLGLQRAYYYTLGEEFLQKIQALHDDPDVDAVIVTLHFGEEYGAAHNRGQEVMAYRMIDAGADMIVGTHTHIIQGMEIYNDRLIFYSLGNFVFGGNSNIRSMQAIIPRVIFRFSDDGALEGVKLRIYPAHISGDDSGMDNDNNYQPVLVQGKQAQTVYDMLDNDSVSMPAPVPEAVTDEYREYQWINITPQQ